MKDHEIAKLVNDLRDIAATYRDSRQLRERIASVIVPLLRDERSPDDPSERRTPITFLHDEVTALRAAASRVQMLARRLVRDEGPDITPERALVRQAEYIGRLERITAIRPPMTDSQCVAIAESIGHCHHYYPSVAAHGRAMVNAVLAAIQQHSGTVTASPDGPSQTLDCGAAGPTRTGDLLITNQPTDSAIYPDNQALSELSESPRPVDDGAQDSSTYADVTARGSPKLFGVDLASSRGMEHPSPRDFLLAVTSIAHCGGLVGLSPQAALSAVRFVTLPYFDPKETTGAHRRRIKVALSNKLDALLND